MVNPIEIVTWNIGTGNGSPDSYTPEPFGGFHILSEQSTKFADVIAKLNPDFVCLQEVHCQENAYSQSEEIANLVGFKYYREMPLDNTHHFMKDGLKIGISILSRHEIIDTKKYLLTNPNIEVKQKDGITWRTHDKGFVSIKANVPGIGDVSIVCIHLLPFHLFNLDVSDNRVLSVWKEIDERLSVYSDHAIICGDFNQNGLVPFLQNLFNRYGFKDILFTKPTHRNTYFDHIVLSPKFTVLKSEVFDNYKYSDHYPCFAEIGST